MVPSIREAVKEDRIAIENVQTCHKTSQVYISFTIQ